MQRKKGMGDYAKLRDLLNRKPSEKNWKAICSLLHVWPLEDMSLAIEYANEHLQHWPIEVRYLEGLHFGGRLPCWFPLVRKMRFHTEKAALPAVFSKQKEEFLVLEHLDLSRCEKLKDISPIAEFTNLKVLSLASCAALENLDSLQTLTKLESVDMSGCCEVKNMDFLSSLKELQQLDLKDCFDLKSVPNLGPESKIRTLNICGCGSLTDFTFLSGLEQIHELNLRRCGIPDLAPITELNHLENLDISENWNLEDFSLLASKKKLKRLKLRSLHHLKNLDFVIPIKSLQDIDVSWCGSLASLDALASLKKLRRLNLHGCSLLETGLEEERGLLSSKTRVSSFLSSFLSQ